MILLLKQNTLDVLFLKESDMLRNEPTDTAERALKIPAPLALGSVAVFYMLRRLGPATVPFVFADERALSLGELPRLLKSTERPWTSAITSSERSFIAPPTPTLVKDYRRSYGQLEWHLDVLIQIARVEPVVEALEVLVELLEVRLEVAPGFGPHVRPIPRLGFRGGNHDLSCRVLGIRLAVRLCTGECGVEDGMQRFVARYRHLVHPSCKRCVPARHQFSVPFACRKSLACAL